MAGHKEGKVERYFITSVRKAGGLTRKTRWLCRNGAPDQFWALNGCYGLAEMKAPGKQLKPHQAREMERLKAQGVDVRVFDETEQIDAFIAEITAN